MPTIVTQTLDQFIPTNAQPYYEIASARPQLTMVNGQSVLAFDELDIITFASIWDMGYADGGIRVTIEWAAATALSGTCIWRYSIERHQQGTTSLFPNTLAGNTGAFTNLGTVSATPDPVLGRPVYSSVTFAHGALIGIQRGEGYRLTVKRDASTMLGRAYLYSVEITNLT